MRFGATFAAIGALAVFAAALPSSASPVSASSNTHERRASSNITITTGANGGQGDVKTRLEIEDLASRPDQWALYIQAMQQWQNTAQDDTTGYWGIAGIHGVPLQDWDGIAQCDSCSDAVGYGTHDMILFPAWHRVYLALFEQELLSIALEVAESYPASSRERMLAAQAELRL